MRQVLMVKSIAIFALPFSLLMGVATAQESAFDKAYDPTTKTIHLNPDDPTGDLIFQKRDFSKDNRPRGRSTSSVRMPDSPGTGFRRFGGCPLR